MVELRVHVQRPGALNGYETARLSHTTLMCTGRSVAAQLQMAQVLPDLEGLAEPGGLDSVDQQDRRSLLQSRLCCLYRKKSTFKASVIFEKCLGDLSQRISQSETHHGNVNTLARVVPVPVPYKLPVKLLSWPQFSSKKR